MRSFTSDQMYYVKAHIRFAWGFTSKILTASKTRESYLIPPPTTLIGALAYGYARLNNMPEEIDNESSAELVRRIIVSVNEKIDSPLIQYSDLSRIWWYRAREKIAKYDAVAIGKIYRGVPKSRYDLSVIYVVREKENLNKLAISAHSIIRVGGSYGLVSVEEVEHGSLSCESREIVSTKYSFWEDLAIDFSRDDVLIQEVVDYKKSSIGSYINASLRRRVYPYSRTYISSKEIKVKIDPKKAFVCNAGGEVIIVEH